MMRRALLLCLLLCLTACGFHLRGEQNMPFASLYLDIKGGQSLFVVELRRALSMSKIRLVERPEDAEVVLQIVSELADKQILTLAGTGRVNEFQLRYRVSLRAYDVQKNDWIPADELSLYRNFSYDDTKILSKEAEEALLYQSMRNDMVQQILRRLSRAHPIPPSE
jgi:LPS-assembly lipoprotein